MRIEIGVLCQHLAKRSGNGIGSDTSVVWDCGRITYGLVGVDAFRCSTILLCSPAYDQLFTPVELGAKTPEIPWGPERRRP
jgi:hypothetical protein